MLHCLSQALLKAWYQNRLVFWLWPWAPLSGAYAIGTGLHRLWHTGLRKPYRYPAGCVISVGNLTVGGTGKTPVVKALAQWLAINQKQRVAIICRGHGAQQPLPNGQVLGPNQGDEADELACFAQDISPNIEVLAGKNRVALLKQLASRPTPPSIVLLDDAFQHWAVARDVDWVLVDAQRGLGNRFLLPAGPLREPVAALSRAHEVLQTRGADCPMALGLPYALTGQSGNLTAKNVLALSAIGHPESFETLLAEAGYHVAAHGVFPDHYAYTRQTVITWLSAYPDTLPVLTTEKDATKLAVLDLPESIQQRFWVMPLQVTLPQAALARLLERLNVKLGLPT